MKIISQMFDSALTDENVKV